MRSSCGRNVGLPHQRRRFSVYAHGNYVSKQVEGGFYYRNPNTRSGVYGTSRDSTLADGTKVYDPDDPDEIVQVPLLLVGDMLDARRRRA